MKKTIMSFIVTLAISTSAFAQSTPAPVLSPTPQIPAAPDDAAVESQRIRVIDEQNRLFSMVLMSDRVKAEATAAWWAEIWKALVEAKNPK